MQVDAANCGELAQDLGPSCWSLLFVMAPQPQVVPIRKLLVLQRGCYFKTCRPYCTNSGIKYDYKLYNWRGNFLPPAIFGKLRDISFLGPPAPKFSTTSPSLPLPTISHVRLLKWRVYSYHGCVALERQWSKIFQGAAPPGPPLYLKGKIFFS